jgi:hypothetical protein
MTRVRSTFLAVAALALSAGAVLAFTALPDASGPGLQRASEAAGKTVPVRAVPAPDLEPVPATVLDETVLPEPVVETENHGSDVSAAAKGDDPTPDTNRGADVSAAAKANHGQDVAAERRPAEAGKPADAGKPEGAGKPDDPGQPADPGPPDGAGRP